MGSLLGLVITTTPNVLNLASILHPLNQPDIKWNWTPKCDQVLITVKKKLLSSSLLVHYDIQLVIRMSSDASAYVISAVISHVFSNGMEHPITFTSHTLRSAEKNYSQIENKALSFIFVIQHLTNICM